MAAKAHAILSASSSDRWLHCPPSARLCETYEDKGSDYAAEGTDAHALGEHKLKTALGLPSDDPTDSLKWYSEEMEDCTSGYAEYVLEQIEAALRKRDMTAGNLDHPIFGIRYCYFTLLELTQEPKENYVSYRFEFTQAKANGEVPK